MPVGWRVSRAWPRSAPLAGVTVARSMTRRTTSDDPYDGEDFELLDADRSSVVTTPDGVDAGGARGRPGGRAADGGVRARILPAHGRLLLSARTAGRAVGPAGADGLLRPSRARPVGGGPAGHLHRRATGQGPGNRARRDGAQGAGGARRAFDGRHDRAVARPAVPAALSHPHRRRRADLLCRRRCCALAAGGDPEEPGPGGGSVRRPLRPENRAPRPRRRQVDHRPDPAGGVLRRREGQPERGRVLREDDARHPDRHPGRIPARVGGARRGRRGCARWPRCRP